jgi:chemotaxis response regulator CheB
VDHDVIVLGAYGGVQAIPQLMGRLPADLPAAVLAVLHTQRAGVDADLAEEGKEERRWASVA